MLIIANDHWNFDVRGFNPGGNHGSFFRISTHSIFMIAGGSNTKIPQALTIEAPLRQSECDPDAAGTHGQFTR